MHFSYFMKRKQNQSSCEALERRCLLAAGDLDTTFSADGFDTRKPGGTVLDSAAVVQADGKPVVAVLTTSGGKRTKTVYRYLKSGTVDWSFGASGKLTLPSGVTNGPLVDAVGRLFFSSDTTLYRYIASGKLDKTFGGGDGILPTAKPVTFLRADGRYVSQQGNKVSLLKNDGTLDKSFGTNGTRNYGDFKITQILSQKDSKLLIVGYSTGLDGYGLPNNYHSVARLTSSGKLDTSYGESGWANLGGDEVQYPAKAVLQSDGKLVVGINDSEAIPFFFLTRLSTGGKLDPSFADYVDEDTGFAQRSVKVPLSYMTSLEDLAIDRSGKILGLSANSDYTPTDDGRTRSTTFRLNNTGASDLSFSFDGFSAFAGFGSSIFAPDSLAVSPTGEIYQTGRRLTNSGGLSDSLVIARLTSSPPTPPLASLSSTGTLNIFSTSGNDKINVRESSFDVEVQRGDEVVWFKGSLVKRVYADAGGGNDRVTVDIARPATVLGGSGNDSLYGGSRNDALNGGSGNDYVRGRAGDDVVEGNSGDDKLFGDQGNDGLHGGAGNDLLDGNEGSDAMFGQDGDDDLFSLDLVRDMVDGGAGTDSATCDVGDNEIWDSLSSIEDIVH